MEGSQDDLAAEEQEDSCLFLDALLHPLLCPRSRNSDGCQVPLPVHGDSLKEDPGLVLDSSHHESWMAIVKSYLPSPTFCIKISFHAAKACCCQFRGCVQCVIIPEKCIFLHYSRSLFYMEPLKKCAFPHTHRYIYILYNLISTCLYVELCNLVTSIYLS